MKLLFAIKIYILGAATMNVVAVQQQGGLRSLAEDPAPPPEQTHENFPDWGKRSLAEDPAPPPEQTHENFPDWGKRSLAEDPAPPPEQTHENFPDWGK
jgi:hypothetical protein